MLLTRAWGCVQPATSWPQAQPCYFGGWAPRDSGHHVGRSPAAARAGGRALALACSGLGGEVRAGCFARLRAESELPALAWALSDPLQESRRLLVSYSPLPVGRLVSLLSAAVSSSTAHPGSSLWLPLAAQLRKPLSVAAAAAQPVRPPSPGPSRPVCRLLAPPSGAREPAGACTGELRPARDSPAAAVSRPALGRMGTPAVLPAGSPFPSPCPPRKHKREKTKLLPSFSPSLTIWPSHLLFMVFTPPSSLVGRLHLQDSPFWWWW